ESGVQATEIAGAYESMLVNEQARGGNDARERDWSEPRDYEQPHEREKRGCVQPARDPKRARNPEPRRDGPQTLFTIEVIVLTCVEHVKAGGPKQDHERQQQRHRAAKLAAHCNPGSRWRD